MRNCFGGSGSKSRRDSKQRHNGKLPKEIEYTEDIEKECKKIKL